jgi:hypothetical protein
LETKVIQSKLWEGANFVKELHVVDDNIITANPCGSISFAIALARKLGFFKDKNEELCKAAFNESIDFDWEMIKPIPDEEWEKMRDE